MAVPTHVAGGALSALASGTTQTPAMPAGYAAGDIFIAWCANNGGQTISVSAGWTPIGTVISGNANFNAGWWYKVATASSGETAPVFTHGAAGSATIGHYAQVRAWRGVDLSSPIEQVVNQGVPTTSNAPRWGPLTTQGADRLVLAFALVDAAVAWSAATRTGWTEIDNNTSTVGGDVATFIIQKAEATTGTAYGSTEAFVNTPFNMNSAAYWRTLSFALVPPSPSRFKRWNGSAWVVAPFKQHNGSIWVPKTFKKLP
jgi:hypothetical protein